MAAALLLAGLGAGAAAGEEPAGGWTPDALATRYGLTVKPLDNGAFQLDGAGVRIRGAAGESRLEVNRLRYGLSKPLPAGQAALEERDVIGLLDPLLRPSRHIEAKPLREVYLEPGGGGADLAARISAALQSVLEGYELKVRPAGGALPEGDFLWLRLKPKPDEAGNRESRCLVLAPSAPGGAGGGVPPGEFYDAESLILATLIQTGLVLGPGAAGGGAVDSGIDRVPLPDFAKVPAPAVCVEWGGGLHPEHVVKSLAAGILRFQRFLAGNSKGQPAFGRREMKLSRVDLRNSPAGDALQMLLSISGKAADLAPAAQPAIGIPCRFFVLDADGLVRMLEAPATRLEWGPVTQVPGDQSAMATLRATLTLPAPDFERLQNGFWGYAVWLVRNGVVEDRRATPERLTDQLWRWEDDKKSALQGGIHPPE